MKVSCLKWNLFRFGNETQITYLQNQHVFFLFHHNKVTSCLSFSVLEQKMSGIYRSLFLCDFLFSLTADKINNLTRAVPAACWILLCFCCDFEAWKCIKARLIWSRQEYLVLFSKTGCLLGKMLFLQPWDLLNIL